MTYKPSPTSGKATEAVLSAVELLPVKDKRDAKFRADMLAAQVKSRNHRKGHKIPFSQAMALEVVGKLSLFLLKKGAV
jgi:hypothetical protein